MRIFKYTEKDLNINLSDLAAETIRELDLACRKVSIYTEHHPLAQKAMGRLLDCFEKIYKFKKYLDIYNQSGHLYVFNVQVKQSVFCDHIIDFMQVLDIRSLLLDVSIKSHELAVFLEAFSSRKHTLHDLNPLTKTLKEQSVKTVLVESELGRKLFEANPGCGLDLAGGYTLRNVVTGALGEDLVRLAEIASDENLDVDEFTQKHSLDYYPRLVGYLIPEIVSSLDFTGLINKVNKIAGKSDAIEGQGDKEKSSVALDKLGKLISFHPDLEKIGSNLADSCEAEDNTPSLLSELTYNGESSERIDQFLYATFNEALPGHKLEDFYGIFERLIRTGQKGRAANVINILMSHLVGDGVRQRESSLALLKDVLRASRGLGAYDLIGIVIDKLDEYLSNKKETFEFSDLIWEIAQSSLRLKDGQSLGRICGILSSRRSVEGDITVYQSAAVRKALDELNRPEIIDSLIEDLIHGSTSWFKYVKKTLVTIGSEEAAWALARIISYDCRQVRLHVLKILSEMGKASLNVCTGILRNNEFFELPQDRRELPDETWFIVRNALTVLGSLKDPEACKALGPRISHDDYRVRRAIVSALESIGTEECADLLLLMAEDPDREIREAAIIALGIIGVSEISTELIELASRSNGDILGIIATLGKIGGKGSSNFLKRLLEDNHFLAEYASGKSSRDDIRLAAIRALGNIGGEESSETLRNFQNNLSKTSKILLGGSKLDKAASEAIAKSGR